MGRRVPLQGRLHDVLEVAREYRRLNERLASDSFAARQASVPEAYVLLEQGRSREAAALVDSMGTVRHTPPPNAPDSMPGAAAFDRIWCLTHVGIALAAAGDTTRLAVLADSAESLGLLSAYVRDRRIHHHLRGLLWTARGRLYARRVANAWQHADPILRERRERAYRFCGRPAESPCPRRPALIGIGGRLAHAVAHAPLQALS